MYIAVQNTGERNGCIHKRRQLPNYCFGGRTIRHLGGVTLNGCFYGDYFKKEWAKQAALEKANLLHLDGKRAQVEITDDRGDVIVITDEERFFGLQ